MARTPRVRTEEGFYHVILRGSGRQILFENDGDRRLLLALLGRCLGEAGISILAWCLMSNHVHLLLCDPKGELSPAIQRCTGSYAGHFNRLTGHVGHVFEGRFKSVPVTNERQLLQVLRYIHDNPERAGVCRASEYRWSSFSEYASGRSEVADVGPLLELLGGVEGFAALCASADRGTYVERTGAFVSDDDALLAAREALGGVDPATLKGLRPAERNPTLQLLRDAELTIRQVERLTGIGRSTISHATHRSTERLA